MDMEPFTTREIVKEILMFGVDLPNPYLCPGNVVLTKMKGFHLAVQAFKTLKKQKS